MEAYSITRMGTPLLHQPSVAINDFSSVQEIIDRMIKTLEQLGGVGLAAPQIGKPLQIFVMRILPERAERCACDPLPFTVFINPSVIISDEKIITEPEACFSLPELIGDVPRFYSLNYQAYDRDGNLFQGEFRGFPARVFQHEYDHLQGILYWQRVTAPHRFGYLDCVPGAVEPRSGRLIIK
ncbi:MAG: peptide deformylase [Legionellales bacterium]|nr:peptide deformylase [Legionellales bacterium]